MEIHRTGVQLTHATSLDTRLSYREVVSCFEHLHTGLSSHSTRRHTQNFYRCTAWVSAVWEVVLTRLCPHPRLSQGASLSLGSVFNF